MEFLKYMKVLPAVAALLLTAACSNEFEIVEEPLSEEGRIIPYTASVGSNVATRATLDSYNYYVFETGDKLYVWGTDISGELALTSGAGEYAANFSGELTWKGAGDPADDLVLNAVIVSPGNMIFGTLAQFNERGHVPDYQLVPGYASSLSEAVQKFAHFQTTSTFGDKEFAFTSQYTAYVIFSITLEDGTAAESTFNVSITNNEEVVRVGSVTTVDESGVIKANFITGFSSYDASWYPLPKVYPLNNAVVKLGDRDMISFGGTSTLNGDVCYNVKRTYTRYTITASATIPGLGAKEKTTDNKPMGYETTLQTLMTEMGAGEAFSMVNNCTKTEGASVNLTPVGDPASDYKFTVVGEGSSVFQMATLMGNIPVTISVAKMTPAP